MTTYDFVLYGCSDDLIELEGGLYEEFNIYDAGYVAFTDGTVIKAALGGDEGWYYKIIATGPEAAIEDTLIGDRQRAGLHLTISVEGKLYAVGGTVLAESKT